jgi:hypothetical protein
MKRTILALAIAGLSVAAYASPPPGGGPPTPIDVTVVNAQPIEVKGVTTTIPSLPTEPYQKTINSLAWTSSDSATYSYVDFWNATTWMVPSGKVLVIQYVSAVAPVNPGEDVIVSITCQGGMSTGGLADITFRAEPTFNMGSFEVMTAAKAVTCYATSPIAELRRNSALAVSSYGGYLPSVTIVGYLIDEPTP